MNNANLKLKELNDVITKGKELLADSQKANQVSKRSCEEDQWLTNTKELSDNVKALKRSDEILKNVSELVGVDAEELENRLSNAQNEYSVR
jgi:hypothetical protein